MATVKHSYKIISYVNASHAMRWEGGMGKEHNHTWEVICEIHTRENQMVIFNDMEKSVNEVLSLINGKFLNDLAYFETVNPSVENVTVYLFNLIRKELKKIHARLSQIEVGESPTRFYCLSVDEDE